MAAEAVQGISAQPITPTFAERAVQKVTPNAPPVASPIPAPNGSRSLQGRLPETVAAITKPAAELQNIAREELQSTKQIRLDFRALRQSGMITPDNMSSPLSNEYRGIKRKLLQKVRDARTRATTNNLVMITSSLPQEGKTFTSVNLAMSLAAERGLRVLLIDADVVRPSVGNMFVSPPTEGLTDLLKGRDKQVSDVLHTCNDVPNLSVIFAGNHHAQSPELISSTRMANLCQELSVRYPDRVIVLDTPPVLVSPEAAILATYVHQLILVVSAAQTDKHQLRKTLEAVSSCQNVSLLFNKAPRWNDGEYNGYYGYGYGASSASGDAPALQT
jgi:receptor protein-tyrosine kinase